MRFTLLGKERQKSIQYMFLSDSLKSFADPTRPNVSRWNIVCIGYVRPVFALGMLLDFMFVCVNFGHVGYPPNTITVSDGIWVIEDKTSFPF